MLAIKIRMIKTFHDASLRDITSLTEPERGVETLVHPLPVPLLQQASVLVSKVQRIELLHRELLGGNIFVISAEESETEILTPTN